MVEYLSEPQLSSQASPFGEYVTRSPPVPTVHQLRFFCILSLYFCSPPGSTVTAEAAAALASCAAVYKDIDSKYAKECLTHAKQLYEFAESTKSDSGYTAANGFYNSWSGFYDELVLARVTFYQIIVYPLYACECVLKLTALFVGVFVLVNAPREHCGGVRHGQIETGGAVGNSKLSENGDGKEGSAGKGSYNYGEALQKALIFYELQRSGDIDEKTARCNWRGRTDGSYALPQPRPTNCGRRCRLQPDNNTRPCSGDILSDNRLSTLCLLRYQRKHG